MVLPVESKATPKVTSWFVTLKLPASRCICGARPAALFPIASNEPAASPRAWVDGNLADLDVHLQASASGRLSTFPVHPVPPLNHTLPSMLPRLAAPPIGSPEPLLLLPAAPAASCLFSSSYNASSMKMRVL